MGKRALGIATISLENILWVRFLSFFFEVKCWRTQVPLDSRNTRISVLEVEAFISHDEWMEEEAQIVRVLGQSRFAGAQSPLEVSGVQLLALDFRRARLGRFAFEKYCEAMGKDGVFLPYFLEGIVEPFRWSSFFGLRLIQKAGVFLGAAAFLGMSLAKTTKTFLRALSGFARGGSTAIPVCDILWTSVTPAEVPTRDGQLDFSFIRHAGPVSRILYSVDHALSGEAREYIERHGIRVENRSTLERSVGRKDLGLFLKECLRNVVRLRHPRLTCLSPWLFRVIIEGARWRAIQRKLGFKHWVSSLSTTNPEYPETALLAEKESGVTTWLWHYAGSDFPLSDSRSGVTPANLTLDGCFPVALNRVLWTRDAVDTLKSRMAVCGVRSKTEFHAVGPVMAGSLSCRDRSSAGDRAHPMIVVFDWPRATLSLARNAGVGPNRFMLETVDQFYRDLWLLFEEEPQWFWGLKPKRSFTDAKREYPESLSRFLQDRSGRVTQFQGDVDPYEPIRAAAVCLGLPFTSPVLAAEMLGKPGFFYLPSEASALVAESHPLFPKVAVGYVALRRRIRALGLASSDVGIPPEGDPAVRFLRLLG